MRIAIASDHGGYEMKEHLRGVLEHSGVEVIDLGTNSSQISVDYPDYASKVAEGVRDGVYDRGVLVCGTGIGMSIAANRVPGVRAALCHDEATARLSRAHNDANVLCLGGRILNLAQGEAILDIWLKGEFEGDRHQRRLALIPGGYAHS